MNVIPLEAARRLRENREARLAIYLCSSSENFETLLSFPFINLKPVHSLASLRKIILEMNPDLFIIYSDIEWADSITLVEMIHIFCDAPILAIGKTKTSPSKMKQIFSAGAHDALYSPLNRDDLREALDVLLKFRQQLIESY